MNPDKTKTGKSVVIVKRALCAKDLCNSCVSPVFSVVKILFFDPRESAAKRI